MPASKIETRTQITLEELKQLGGVSGPCVSILIPVQTAPNQAAQNPVQLKHAIHQAEELLAARATPKDVRRQIVDGMHGISQDLAWAAEGLALYCAPEFTRAYELPAKLNETVAVGGHFLIRPLIPLLNADRPFYILALSQKHPRLLRCTEHTSEERELPAGTPKSLWEDKDTDQPDHNQDNRASGGPSEGSMKGVISTTNTDSEDHEQYLAHFYKHLSEGVTALLKDENAPLVIAGVEYEIAAFRRVNVYPELAEEAVRGAADGLKGGELHKRALEAVQVHFQQPLKKALARFEELNSTRASSTLKEIITAAFDGRVMDLILAENATYMGKFQEMQHEVKGHKQPEPDDEDLLNAAALQTILHAGEVFVVPASQVPHGAPAVAVFRY